MISPHPWPNCILLQFGVFYSLFWSLLHVSFVKMVEPLSIVPRALFGMPLRACTRLFVFKQQPCHVPYHKLPTGSLHCSRRLQSSMEENLLLQRKEKVKSPTDHVKWESQLTGLWLMRTRKLKFVAFETSALTKQKWVFENSRIITQLSLASSLQNLCFSNPEFLEYLLGQQGPCSYLCQSCSLVWAQGDRRPTAPAVRLPFT